MHPPKVVLVTGANRGIGLAIVQHYAALDTTEQVIPVYRTASEELTTLCTSNPKVVPIQVTDLASENVVSTLPAALATAGITSSIDLLVNNAAVNLRSELDDLDESEFLKILQVNVVGPHLVTRYLKPKLSTNALVCFISSTLGSTQAPNPPHDGALPGYRVSKAALNMLMRVYHYTNTDFRWVSVCPGWVDTDMGSYDGKYTPDLDSSTSAANVAKICGQIKPDDSGTYWSSSTGNQLEF